MTALSVVLLIVAQASAIPTEVWVALIAAFSGSLIKPVIELFGNQFSTKRESEAAKQRERVERERKLVADITELKSKLEAARDEYARQLALQGEAHQERLLELQEQINHWREKYFSALERFSQAHGGARPLGTDLSDPEVLKEVIRHILD
jgi:hypothetical protein